MVSRGKFTEALTFARNFDLDMQQVYAAKASYLKDQLSIWGHTEAELLDEKYRDWKATLDCLTDINFVVEEDDFVFYSRIV